MSRIVTAGTNSACYKMWEATQSRLKDAPAQHVALERISFAERRRPIAKRNRNVDVDVRGDLQAVVMAAIWKIGPSKVEDVRQALPGRQRPAYTTVQTIMNRLSKRGLLRRKQVGNAFVYEARYDEAELLARSINGRLAGASPMARREAVLNLVGDLDVAELDEVARIAAKIKREHKRP